MAKLKLNDPVSFPVYTSTHTEHVITKREYFAALAMQAFINSVFTNTGGQAASFTDEDGMTFSASPNRIAKQALMYADALIAELNKVQDDES